MWDTRLCPFVPRFFLLFEIVCLLMCLLKCLVRRVAGTRHGRNQASRSVRLLRIDVVRVVWYGAPMTRLVLYAFFVRFSEHLALSSLTPFSFTTDPMFPFLLCPSFRLVVSSPHCILPHSTSWLKIMECTENRCGNVLGTRLNVLRICRRPNFY